MAKRRTPQPRDSRGRFTSDKTPAWFIILFVVIVLAALMAK
ncbi:hypothetical protein [Streptomyces sp. NRRL S-1521]|nr:hypothetical protein [Streptomyces sp. NRRL S-1521]